MLFWHNSRKKYMNKRRFYYEARIKITRKEAREHLEQFHLACELVHRIINNWRN